MLRYLGTITQGHGKLGIEKVDERHSLAVIRDGENVLAILSADDQPRRVVTRGYGAG